MNGRLFVAMALVAGLMAAPVYAQPRNCGPHQAVVERLASQYGESRQSIGLGANNAVVEVFANEETGSWTITVTQPTGLSCLVAAGQSYEKLSEELPNTDDDA